MTAAAHSSRPFAFDTEFDASGVVVTPSSFRPAKRAYAAAEVEALVAQARLEAREAALGEADSLRAMALSAIGQALATGGPILATTAQRHREQAAELALAAGRTIAGAAMERMPTGPLKTALDALAHEIDACPRLLVRAGGLDDAARAEITRLAAEAGFTGAVAFADEPVAAPAAFVLEWADGRAEYDPAACAARVAEALAAALAAEAGHGELLAAEDMHAVSPYGSAD